MGCKRKEEAGNELAATNCLQDKTWGVSRVRSGMIAASLGEGVYSHPFWLDCSWCQLESGVAVGRCHVSREV